MHILSRPYIPYVAYLIQLLYKASLSMCVEALRCGKISLFLPNPIISRSAVDGVQSNQCVGRRNESASLRNDGQLKRRDTQQQL